VYQAQLLVQQAEAEVIALQQSMEVSENQLSTLLGRNPGPIARGLDLTDQPHLSDVPAGLPSAVLERRPGRPSVRRKLDRCECECGSSEGGLSSADTLHRILRSTEYSSDQLPAGPATFWTLGGQLAQPLYAGGRIRSGYRLALAQRDDAVLSYQQVVQAAFQEVSNNLVSYAQSRKYRMKLQEQTATYKEAARLANVRFKGERRAFLRY
jgi:outer membrane protein, multidrug efflux system